MKLATWNVNSLNVRLPQVLDWLAANPVDALCLQELKLTDDKFPEAAFTGPAITPSGPARRPTTASPSCRARPAPAWCATSPASRTRSSACWR